MIYECTLYMKWYRTKNLWYSRRFKNVNILETGAKNGLTSEVNR